jgi:hypothetical protein
MKLSKIIILGSMVHVMILLVACGFSDTRRGYSLGKEQIVNILVDLQVVKAAAFKYPEEMRDSISEVFLAQVYTIHDVDRFEFERNVRRLEKDAEYYKEISEEVYQKLVAMNNLKEE